MLMLLAVATAVVVPSAALPLFATTALLVVAALVLGSSSRNGRSLGAAPRRRDRRLRGHLRRGTARVLGVRTLRRRSRAVMRMRSAARSATIVSLLAVATMSLGGVGSAVVPSPIDPGRLPGAARPAPLAPTEQRNACAAATVSAGEPNVPLPQRTMSFDTVWPLTRGAGQTVAVIDTGVARHPRLPA
ncbi:hypothetical protein GS909_10260 [Rhodococcus hoagii]|nr:hypothetical protein [Prescottella equi]